MLIRGFLWNQSKVAPQVKDLSFVPVRDEDRSFLFADPAQQVARVAR